MQVKPLLAIAALAAVATTAATTAAQPVPAAIRAAVAAPGRTPADVARDPSRHPAEMLAFFGLKPGMKLAEISPGGGYWTPILAAAVGPRGRVYAVHGDPAESPRAAASIDKARAKYAADRRFANVTVTALGKNAATIAPPGSLDMVVTFRNVHNWMGGGYAETAFKAFHAALKPGGVLGLEEHRLPEGRTGGEGDSGYVKTSSVVRMAEAAGFKLASSSELNANPRDTADYPKGVWTLPPNYAEGTKDRAKYEAIGESDRMTLRFVKAR